VGHSRHLLGGSNSGELWGSSSLSSGGRGRVVNSSRPALRHTGLPHRQDLLQPVSRTGELTGREEDGKLDSSHEGYLENEWLIARNGVFSLKAQLRCELFYDCLTVVYIEEFVFFFLTRAPRVSDWSFC